MHAAAAPKSPTAQQIFSFLGDSSSSVADPSSAAAASSSAATTIVAPSQHQQQRRHQTVGGDDKRVEEFFDVLREGNLPQIKSRMAQSKWNPNARDADGWTALHAAVQSSHDDVVQYIGDALVRCGIREPANIADKEGWTPLHLAVEMGSLSIVKLLIDTFHGDASQTDAAGWAPIHVAASNGHYSTVKYLAEAQCVDTTAARFSDKATPMHVAASAGHTEIVEYFLSRSDAASSSCGVTDCDADGNMPLHCAAANGHASTVRLLLLRAPTAVMIAAENAQRETPLDLALSGGHNEVFIMMNEYARSKAVTTITSNQRTSLLLHSAVSSGRPDTVSCVLDRLPPPVDLNVRSEDGMTALHVAVEGGLLPVVSILLQRGQAAQQLPVMLSARTPQGRTAVDIAKENGHGHIAALLQETPPPGVKR